MSSSPTRRATASTSRTPRARVTVFKENTSGARALRFGADGRLYATQPSRRRLVSYGPGGDEKVVAQKIDANDLAITKAARIYFVDTAQKTVGYIDAKGERRVVYNGGEIMSPAALTLTPDQAMLLVGDGMDRYQWSFQIAADGSLSTASRFSALRCPKKDCSAASPASPWIRSATCGPRARWAFRSASSRAAARTS